MSALPLRAVLGMLLGATLISTSPIWVALADVPATVSGFYRMAFGALFLGLWLLLGRQSLPRRPRAIAIMLLAALFFAADLFFWHRSILYVGPGLSTILANFQVFILALIGGLFLGERLRPAYLFGLLLAMTGLWLLVGLDWSALAQQYQLGVVFGLLTSVAYAAYLLTMRRAQQYTDTPSPQSNLCLVSLLCAGVMAVLVLSEGHSFSIPDLPSLSALMAYGLISQVLGWLLIIHAMPRLPASLVGMMLLLQPALAFCWDMLLFARTTTMLELLGVSLALLGIYLGTASTRSRPDEPEGRG